ncbi:MAG: hypothetical protein JWM27_731 [Gemmatimonadetes bacterium]|nr:hypothetical protein [Gemmatimonadota bacterium]
MQPMRDPPSPDEIASAEAPRSDSPAVERGPSPAPAAAAAVRRQRMRELGIVAVFAVGTMLLVGIVLWLALGGGGKARSASPTPTATARRPAPATQLAPGAPVPDRCLVSAADGRILGRVVAELGSGERTTSYRVEEYPGHGVAPVASTLEVPAAGSRLVPCASLAAKPGAR